MARRYGARVRAVAIAAAVLGGCRGGDPPPTGPAGGYAISGSVVVEGVSVRVDGPVTRVITSGGGGVYTVPGLPPGQYTVRPVQPGFDFAPSSTPVTVENRDVSVPGFTRSEATEYFSDAELEQIAAAPDVFAPEDKIILPSGKSLAEIQTPLLRSRAAAPALPSFGLGSAPGVEGAKDPIAVRDSVVATMLRVAFDYACARFPNPCVKWNFKADPADPVNRPEQKGLAYVYGGRTPAVRVKAKFSDCPELLHGLDCSGLVYLVARAAGLGPPGANEASATTLADPANWTVPDDWGLRLELVKDETIRSGDILAWPAKAGGMRHIGIAWSGNLESTAAAAFAIQASGSPNACAANLTKGPKSMAIAKIGVPAAVLRLVPRKLTDGPGTGYLEVTTRLSGPGETRVGVMRLETPSWRLEQDSPWVRNALRAVYELTGGMVRYTETTEMRGSRSKCTVTSRATGLIGGGRFSGKIWIHREPSGDHTYWGSARVDDVRIATREECVDEDGKPYSSESTTETGALEWDMGRGPNDPDPYAETGRALLKPGGVFQGSLSAESRLGDVVSSATKSWDFTIPGLSELVRSPATLPRDAARH
jgi:hypothetical protein